MTATAMAKSVYSGGFIEELRPCASPLYESRRRRFFLNGTVMATAVFRLAVPVAMPRAAPAQAFAALRNTLSMGFFLSHGLFMLRSFGCGAESKRTGDACRCQGSVTARVSLGAYIPKLAAVPSADP
jgi:hypothetical protein